MHKLRSLFFLLLSLACLASFTGCNDENEASPKPTITFAPTAESDSLAPGARIQLKVSVSSTDKLKEFKMSRESNGSVSDTIVTNFPAAGYEFNLNTLVPNGLAEGAKVTFTFTATTINNEAATRTYTVIVHTKAPVITFDPAASTVNIPRGAPIRFKAMVTSASKLKSFKANIAFTSFSADTIITNFPNAGYEFNVEDEVPYSLAAGSQIVYTFTAINQQNIVTTRIYTVLVVPDILTYTARIIGNQNATTGSFFSSADGIVYSQADAKANQAKIDLVYYYSAVGATAIDMATIASPMNANAQAIYGASTTANIPSWVTKNDTRFKKAAQAGPLYDQATEGSQLQQTFTLLPAAESSSVTLLTTGDVISFKTATGKYGTAKITSLILPTAANGNKSEIGLNVKIQR